MRITQDGAFLRIEEERFVARFPADLKQDLEQLQDQDFYVTVNGGPTYYATPVPRFDWQELACRVCQSN